jgi:hypothetical protein
MALSMMSALIGLSLGAATGLSLAMVSTPASASIAVNDLSQVRFIGNETPVSASTRSSGSSSPSSSQSTSANAQPHATSQAVATASQPGTGESNGGSAQPAADDTSTNRAGKAEHSPATGSSPAKIPAVDENEAPLHPAAPAEALPSRRPVAHPVTKSPRVVLASEQVDESTSIEDESASLDGEGKPPTFYSEGDLTIADYDAANGTIQTLDGKTFVLGLTISSADATGWEDYRSSIHYRCSQEGSCTLTRSGVVAPNARMI